MANRELQDGSHCAGPSRQCAQQFSYGVDCATCLKENVLSPYNTMPYLHPVELFKKKQPQILSDGSTIMDAIWASCLSAFG